jgi:hypothetical protein
LVFNNRTILLTLEPLIIKNEKQGNVRVLF